MQSTNLLKSLISEIFKIKAEIIEIKAEIRKLNNIPKKEMETIDKITDELLISSSTSTAVSEDEK